VTLPGGLDALLFAQTRAAEEESGRIYDAVVGVVTDIADPQKLCRVKVRFPSLGPDTTWWCPLVAPGAGKDRGWFTVPEVDDEVLVMFEHGDVARPVIIGALWNGKDKAIDNNADGKNARRVIRSKTGHKITFEDVEKFILIEDGAGIGSIKIDGKNNTIELTAKQGDIGIQCKDELSILAGEIEIKAKGTCDLMGKSGGVNASSTAALKISGNLVALKGSAIDINPGGVAKAAKASGTVAEVPGSDPGTNTTSAGGGAQGEAASGGGSGGSGNGGAGAGTARDDDALRVLTRDGVKRFTGEVYRGAFDAEALGLIADKDVVKKPLVTAATWSAGDSQWKARRAWTALDDAADPSYGALTVDALCENLGDVIVKILAADGGAVLATATAPVSGGKATWRFEPKAHGLKTCQDVIAEVSGGGSSAKTKEVAHVHQPYWSSPDGKLQYVLKWPSKAVTSFGKSRHYVDEVTSVTVDGAGRANLVAWHGRLTPYMKAHIGVDIPAIMQTDPRCEFDVRDLQADLGAIGFWFDSEASLTGTGFSLADEPSGVFGPLTFLGLTVLDRLSMRDQDTAQVPAGGYRDGQPTTLSGAEKQKLIIIGTGYTPPMKVDGRVAKLVRAWRAGKLTPRLEGPEFEQVAIKWHNDSSFKVQRRQARKILAWLYAIEAVGGFLPSAGPRRDWEWPLWRRYANDRAPSSTHYCGLAMDIPTDQGATTPADRYVIELDQNSRFKTYQNLDVAKASASAKGYPDQTRVAAALGLNLGNLQQDALKQAGPSTTTTTTIRAALHKGQLWSYLDKRRERLAEVAKGLATKHKAALAAATAAARTLFGKDGQVDSLADSALMAQLTADGGTPDQQTQWAIFLEKTGLQLMLAGRARAYRATADGVAALAAFVKDADDAAQRAAALAHYESAMTRLDATIDDLVDQLMRQSGGQAAVDAAQLSSWVRGRGTAPWGFDAAEPKPPRAAAQLDLPGQALLAELMLYLGDRAARATILDRLRLVTAASDAIGMPVEGKFVRIDDLVTDQKLQLHRIGRKAQWEWWHFQFPDPTKPELDAQIIEMARELGFDRIVAMTHKTESYAQSMAGARKEKKEAFAAKQYAWWKGEHPYEVDRDTYATGYNLAELLLAVR